MSLLYNITDIYYVIKSGIINILYWFKIIWKDRNWDFAFIEYILLHKLKAMYKVFKSDKTMLDWGGKRSKSLKALRICITILERRTDVDDYYLSLDLETSLKDRPEDRDFKLLFILMQQYWETWSD